MRCNYITQLSFSAISLRFRGISAKSLHVRLVIRMIYADRNGSRGHSRTRLDTQPASRTRANKFSRLVFPNPCHKARSEVFWAHARLSSGHNVSVSALKASGARKRESLITGWRHIALTRRDGRELYSCAMFLVRMPEEVCFCWAYRRKIKKFQFVMQMGETPLVLSVRER